MQQYLKSEKRYNNDNMLLAALYYGTGKPKMDEYLSPLVQQFKEFELNKLQIVLNKKPIRFEPRIITCCVDLPAKSAVQNMKQFNGKFGCGYCLHPGKSVQINKTKQIRFGRLTYKPKLRLQESTAKIMDMMGPPIEGRLSRFGIKGKPILLDLPHFNVIDGFIIDYMHNVLQGVFKKMFCFWMERKYSRKQRRGFYLSVAHQMLLNKRISSMRPCRFIKRKPRSMIARKKFKANEMRSMLLYYMPIFLMGILPNVYREHFMLLSHSVYILSKKHITSAELEKPLYIRRRIRDVLRNRANDNECTFVITRRRICKKNWSVMDPKCISLRELEWRSFEIR